MKGRLINWKNFLTRMRRMKSGTEKIKTKEGIIILRKKKTKAIIISIIIQKYALLYI